MAPTRTHRVTRLTRDRPLPREGSAHIHEAEKDSQFAQVTYSVESLAVGEEDGP